MEMRYCFKKIAIYLQKKIGNSNDTIREYVEYICNKYSDKTRADVKHKLLKIFGVEQNIIL